MTNALSPQEIVRVPPLDCRNVPSEFRHMVGGPDCQCLRCRREKYLVPAQRARREEPVKPCADIAEFRSPDCPCESCSDERRRRAGLASACYPVQVTPRHELTQADYMNECTRLAMRNIRGQYDEAFAKEGAKIGSALRIRLPADFVVAAPNCGIVSQSIYDGNEHPRLTVYDISIDARRPVTQTEFDGMEKALWQLCREREAKDHEIAELKAVIDSLPNGALDMVIRRDEALAAKDARIAELDTELALLRGLKCDDPQVSPPKTQPANAPTPGGPQAPTPIYPVADTIAPKPNPFRDFRTDPRRMGP
jgi:hypothetical protein